MSSSSSSSSFSATQGCWISSSYTLGLIHDDLIHHNKYEAVVNTVKNSPFYITYDHPLLEWGVDSAIEREGSSSESHHVLFAGKPGYAKWITKEEDTGDENFLNKLLDLLDIHSIIVSPHPNVVALWCVSLSARDEIVFIYPYLGM
eukprot:TRINITY_DN15162_c0_g1_i1.p1 TRINITY_DN15162_c0_g1~~TRINITY_DN15162_c0_g1_i1.p1  ORF type:complete len:160 (-),score=31.18 TRINITY_DN15162_c0_g1_i1:30-467(-)